MQDLLAGPLAAFRNVYKFVPVLSAAAALGSPPSSASCTPPRRCGPLLQAGALASVLAVLAIGALPALRGEVTTPGAFRATPSWWTQAGRLARHPAGRGTTLLLPGSAFAENTWGRPLDEPMQALAQGRG